MSQLGHPGIEENQTPSQLANPDAPTLVARLCRHQAQEQEVAERVLLEPLAELGQPGSCPLVERIADRRAGDQEDDGHAGEHSCVIQGRCPGIFR